MRTELWIGLAMGGLLAAAAQASPVPAGWTVVGNGGIASPNGVVTAPPVMGPDYYYVSTDGGETGGGALAGVGGDGAPTNGSTVTTAAFSAATGAELAFYFNYVTSDGAGYADYAWARLLAADDTEVALLFTARTTPGASTVPGFSMPEPTAILNPAGVSIIDGAPEWDQLGSSSGTCWDLGCGYTGWVEALYTIADEGDYKLQFGVTNWDDTLFASGMAFAGLTVDQTPIGPEVPPVPLPAAAWLLLGGLGTLAAIRRRRRA